MIYNPYHYQDFAFNHIMDNPFCGVFLDMGLGKTVITATAINRMIYEDMSYEKVLVIAPKQVTLTVWKQELQKWDHLKHLRVSIVWGSEPERLRALRVKADVYVTNRDNIVWMVKLFQSKWPFRVVVLDEASSFKNPSTQRFKHMKMVRPQVRRLIELTGTPAPNGLLDLWAPMYLLDEGQRLGATLGGYRERYFTHKNPGERFSGYRLRPDCKEVIYNKISDICISMKSEDYLDLPPLIENDIYLELDKETQAVYNEFEEESIIEIANQEITALNAAALSNKLLQMANGAIYNIDKTWTLVHDVKLDRMEEIVEEAMGKPIICFYSYRHDLDRIQKRFPYARVMKHPEKDVEEWNEGKIKLLVLHPASAGHGLNLQFGGNIMIWFGLTWSLELYLQAIKRIYRPGQEQHVIMHKLIMRKTMDIDVLRSNREKKDGQDALMEAVKAVVDIYRTGGVQAIRGLLADRLN